MWALFGLVYKDDFEHPTFQGVYAFGRKIHIPARLIHFFIATSIRNYFWFYIYYDNQKRKS